MRGAVTAILLVIFATPSTYGQDQETQDMIAHAKRADVSKLDKRLPRRRFADWLTETVGPDATITWGANDCGEQTGTPVNSHRDLPLCVEADAALPDGRKVVLVMAVGTMKKGLTKRPGGFYHSAVWQGEDATTFNKLSELPTILKIGSK